MNERQFIEHFLENHLFNSDSSRMQTNLNESKSARSHYSKSDEGEAFRGLSSRSLGNKFGKNLSRIQSGSLCPYDFSIIPKILSSVTVG